LDKHEENEDVSDDADDANDNRRRVLDKFDGVSAVPFK